ncbi:MAG: FecR family protein [Gammaproteobacteria bacterium]
MQVSPGIFAGLSAALLTVTLVLMPAGESRAQSDPVGATQFARGVVTAQTPGAEPRIVGRGTPLFQGDVMNSGNKSFAVIAFRDGTRMTLRPNTSFAVESYRATRDSAGSGILRLFKGGLRALTGFISKQNPNALQIRTPVSTIGIRGTQFDVRLCEATDCVEETARLAAAQPSRAAANAVGRVVFQRGRLEATSKAGSARPMTVNGVIFEGDTLRTAPRSAAVLVFRDQSRTTLLGNTEFRVEQAQYDEAGTGKNLMAMRLIKGGLRALTGLVAQLTPAAYRVNTPVATIGVRGTGFDLLCVGECVASDENASLTPRWSQPVQQLVSWLIDPARAQRVPADGMYASVWQGNIELQVQPRPVLLTQGRTAFLVDERTQPILFNKTPRIIRRIKAPRPDRLRVSMESLFGTQTITAGPVPAGLYVNVESGIVSLAPAGGAAFDVTPGRAAYQADAGSPPQTLAQAPAFMTGDVFPRPNELNERLQEFLEVFGRDQEEAGEPLECKI